MSFAFNGRVNNSMTGAQFGSSIINNTGQVREDAILQQLTLENIPDFMKTPVEITIVSDDHQLVLDVMPDYFCIGEDADFLRMPMWPATAQAIADRLNATLPTKYLVDRIWNSAKIKLPPHPMPPSVHMISSDCFVNHNNVIETQRANCWGLIVGHKKDIVLTPKLTKGHVAIYGWHYLTGNPIQPLNPYSHSDTYVDYSHGVRLICSDVLLDGNPARFEDILRDPALCKLISDEGPSTVVRYP